MSPGNIVVMSIQITTTIMGRRGYRDEDCRRFTGDRVRYARINQYDQNMTQIAKRTHSKNVRKNATFNNLM
jgi:hypothetical protein